MKFSLSGKYYDSLVMTYSQRRYKHTLRKYVSQMYQNWSQIQPTESQFICKSHKLMIYNDIIAQGHPGAFHLLPLGQRVLDKLIKVIDEELDSIGAQKMSMPTLAKAELWKKTNRWDTAGPELFRLQDRYKQDYCLGPTHEEVITDLISRTETLSYKKLPIKLYQITRKFRDEITPKYGLLRGREFEMKDMYTFDSTEENAKRTYDEVCQVYENIFNRLGLKFRKVIGATGNIGGSLSHEFQLLSSIGEDTIKVCQSCDFGRNIEVEAVSPDEEDTCPQCRSKLEEMSSIEVGHSFLLGTKYSKVLKANFLDKESKPHFTQMGCYGLGVTRILQAGIEVLSDDTRIQWPRLLAPYQICIIPQKEGFMAEKFFELGHTIYDELVNIPHLRGEVVIDDRTKLTVGRRLYEAERIGYPYVVVIGKKALEAEPLMELQNIYNKSKQFLSLSDIIQQLKMIETISM